MAKEEQWRPIPGFGGWYECSDRGRFRSWRRRKGPERLSEPRLMKLSRNKSNHVFVISLRDDAGGKHQYPVSKLMYRTWVGEVPEGMVVVRKDGRLENNRADNFMAVPKKRSFTPAMRQKIGKPSSKGVLKFDQSLELVEVYPSIQKAAAATHYSRRWLSARLNFKQSTGKSVIYKDGFIYAFDDDAFIKKTLDIARKELDSNGIRYNAPHTEKYYEVDDEILRDAASEDEYEEDFEEAELLPDISDAAEREEQWLDVPGYQGWYQVSSLGRVRRWMRYIPNSHPQRYERMSQPVLLKLIKPGKFGTQFIVNLRDPKTFEKHQVSVAALVYQTFIGPIDGRMVFHKWSTFDDRPENLYLVNGRKPKEE